MIRNPIKLSRESRKILIDAEQFRVKTGKDRISLYSKDFKRLANEYAALKPIVNDSIIVNGITFVDGKQ